MLRAIRFSVVVVLVLCGLGPLSAQNKPEIQVVGFTVAAVDKDSEFEQSLVPGSQPGMQIYVRVKLPGRYILELDDQGQQAKLEDSTGQNLKMREGGFSFFANIAEDHQAVTVPFSTETIPASTADTVTLKGEAAVICGSDSTESSVAAELKEAATLQLGKTSAKVTGIGTGFEENSTSIDFESNQPFNTIQELRFVDGSGEEHVAQSRGSGSFGFGNDVTYSQSYEFPAAADAIKSVKVKYFTKVETVKVPIDVKIGLGLGR